jgi:TonB family protein
MKKTTYLLFLLLWGQFSLAQEKIHWMKIDELEAAEAIHPRVVMVDVYTQWCGPCKMMSNQTFTHPDVVKYMNEHFYCVKFDAESGDSVVFKGKTYKNPDFKPGTMGRNGVHELTMNLGVNAYPTLIFFDEALNPIAPITGFQSVENFEIFAKVFATGDYKKVTTQDAWAEYQKNFVRSWTSKPNPEPKKTGPNALFYEITNDTISPELASPYDAPVVPAEEPIKEEPMTMVEQMPVYSDGDVTTAIARLVTYPEMEKENNIQGTVYVQFVVNKEGKVEDVKVIRGVKDGAGLEREAIRAVRSLKPFSPGKQNGKAVSVKMTVPIKFSLK